MAIFPIVEEAEVSDIIEDRGANFLYDFELDDFIIKDGKFIELIEDAAVVFWVEKTLRTEFEKATDYKNTNYGVRLNQFRGAVMPSEIARDAIKDAIETALLQHERIASIENFTFEQIGDDANISFEIKLNALTDTLDLVYTSEDGYTRIATLEEIKDFIGIKLLDANRFLFKTSLGTQIYVG